MCVKCKGQMDVVHDLLCCLCPKPCRASLCWRCGTAWRQGPCATAFFGDLRESVMLEKYETTPTFAVPR